MAILTPVIKLVVFRQSLRPHSAIAFLVEFLCFVLELLDKEKDLAKIFGILCACDTLIFTFLDLIQNLVEEEVKMQRCGRVFWLYTKDGSLYWHTLNAYLLMLCIVHIIGSTITYVSRRHYLVLLPLFAAGLELVPQEAYRILGPDPESRDCIGPIQGLQDHIEPNQEYGDCIGPGLQDNIGPDQESHDCIGPLYGPLDVKDLSHQDYDEVNQESGDCIGILHKPLDGIELEQETIVHVVHVQGPLYGIELEQETIVHELVKGPLDGIEMEGGVVIQVGPDNSP